jgi:peroxiredoxin
MMVGKAPEFELPSLAGGPLSLANLLVSGPVLLVFYKVTCPTCQLTLPFLERLHRGRVDGAPQVVAISQDDRRPTEEFNRRYGLTFTTLLDPHEHRYEEGPGRYPASNAYRIENVPTWFLVEQDGTISRSVAAFDKTEMVLLGRRFGVETFTATDRVPVFQPG